MIVSSQAADALHLASVLQSYDASSAKALIQASLTLHGLALHNLTKAATAAGTANAVVNVQEQVNPADIQPFTDTEAATAAEAANALLNVQDIAGVDAPTVNLCKRIATVEQGQPKRPPEQLLRALDTARVRADGEEAILPGDQWFNRECPAGASNPSPTPLGKRTASGASSIVLQPSAKKVSRSVASAWASEADKYWDIVCLALSNLTVVGKSLSASRCCVASSCEVDSREADSEISPASSCAEACSPTDASCCSCQLNRASTITGRNTMTATT